MKKSILNAISFRYALLDSYKKLNLSEEEVSILLMIDHLMEQGNRFISADMLALKMNYSSKEIDHALGFLMEKGFYGFETTSNGLRSSIEGAKEKAYAQLKKTMDYENASVVGEEKENTLAELNNLFETRFERTLSPLEKSAITEWVNAGFKKEDIKDSLLDALSSGKKSIKAIDRLLRGKQIASDFEKEGYSATDSNWDKDIEETMALAKKMWGQDE